MKKTTSKVIVTCLDESVTVVKGMYFVCATDKFMSNWGRAEGKTAKRVIICNTYREAQRIADAFKNNPNSYMKYVNITSKCPSYPASRFVTSWSTFEDFNNDAWMKWTNIPA